MSMFQLFTEFPIFNGLEQDELFSLLTRVSLDFEKYQEGEIMLKEGESSRGLVFLMNGKVSCREAGRSYEAEAPCLLVWTGIFGSRPVVPVTLRALDDCGLMCIDAEACLQLFGQSKTILRNYLDLLCDSQTKFK